MMGEGSGLIPEKVLDSVKTTLTNMEQVETNLLHLLSFFESDLITDLPPLQRAHSLFFLAKATSFLVSLRLKCCGIRPEKHPVNTELERIRLYEDKLGKFIDLSKAPLRPSTTLNYQAATRFIEHSLPDLTSEQRKCMREISKGEGPRMKYLMKYLDRGVQKKRKYQSSEKKSVQSAADEFLEKAAREIFGASEGDVKGPVRLDTSDEDISEV